MIRRLRSCVRPLVFPGLLLGLAKVVLAAAPVAPNPYQVERSWPDYFLEHQKLFTILEIIPGQIARGTPKVSLSAAQLLQVMKGEPLPAGVGDGETLQKLLGYLDREQPGFYMHVR